MNSYVDYDYYFNTFKGNLIPRKKFDSIIIKASSKINYYTFNRISENDITNKVKNATCSIAELLYEQESIKQKLLNNDNSNKTSETVGPWTISYCDNSQYQDKQIKTDKELNESIYQVCKEYLLDTGLMYRGI